jgi:hypothetical protein
MVRALGPVLLHFLFETQYLTFIYSHQKYERPNVLTQQYFVSSYVFTAHKYQSSIQVEQVTEDFLNPVNRNTNLTINTE